MVERQDDEHDRVRLNGHYRVSLLHIGSIVPVSQENALRVGSGSRGVADIGIVVRADGSVAGLEFARMLLQEGIAERKHLRHCDFIVPAVLNLVEDNYFLQCRKFTHNPPDFRKLGAGNHHETGIRMADAEDEVTPLLQLYGKRNVDRSGIENAEFPDHPEVAALGKKGNLVTLVYPERHEPGSDTVGLKPRLLECSLSPMIRRFLAEEYVGGILSGIFLHEINDSQSFWHIHKN